MDFGFTGPVPGWPTPLALNASQWPMLHVGHSQPAPLYCNCETCVGLKKRPPSKTTTAPCEHREFRWRIWLWIYEAARCCRSRRTDDAAVRGCCAFAGRFGGGYGGLRAAPVPQPRNTTRQHTRGAHAYARNPTPALTATPTMPRSPRLPFFIAVFLESDVEPFEGF